MLDPNTVVYGDNPLRRVPTLVLNGETLFESDHIARCLVKNYDPADRFRVRSEAPADLNRLAVVNGIMANEVVLLLAQRTGLREAAANAYFQKLRASMEAGLTWLDSHLGPDEEPFVYGDMAILCLWQHLEHYQLVGNLPRHARLAARVARFADRPSVVSTAPHASLVEAAAAGWTAG